MRETILSNCERNFILKAASELKRLDGRKLEGFRNLKVLFGRDWGSCYVALGETKVLTQVTCEIQEPKTTKPNEGLLFINVELSSMASSNFEPGRASNLSIHINRLMEKCIKDSRAVDLESLCIVAEDKVWVLRVDINILNHDGCLVDCASISALAALAHFKRPDVTTDGEEITVHNISDRDPIPITLHHYPICVSFALLNNSENIFADPTAIEERVSDAELTFGINAYNEICCLHLGGTALIDPKLILTCSKRAAVRSKKVVEIINSALQKDSQLRQIKESVGFVYAFEWDRITAISEGRLQVQLNKFTLQTVASQPENHESVSAEECFEIKDLGDNCAELNVKPINESKRKENTNFEVLSSSVSHKAKMPSLPYLEPSYGEGGTSKWNIDMSGSYTTSSSLAGIEVTELQERKIENIDFCDLNEEEEEVVVLNMLEPNDLQNKRPLSSIKRHSEKIQGVQEKTVSLNSASGKSKKRKKNKK